MELNQMIFPNQVREVLSSNEVSQIQLKDGTIIRINEPNVPNYNTFKETKLNEVELEEEQAEKGHNHHKGEFGYFGHHFKTEYNELCPDCLSCGGGVVKKRKNYVLYVSKNCTESDVALKHKLKNKEKEKIKNQINEQIQEQIQDQIQEQIKENIEEQIQEKIKLILT